MQIYGGLRLSSASWAGGNESSHRGRCSTHGDAAKVIRLPPLSPNLNAYGERFVRSIKEECLRKMIFIGQASLRRAIAEYTVHFQEERNHQGRRIVWCAESRQVLRTIRPSVVGPGSAECSVTTSMPLHKPLTVGAGTNPSLPVAPSPFFFMLRSLPECCALRLEGPPIC